MTELIWDGKYKDFLLDKSRGRVKTAPVRIALPFQTIETVNESAQQRQKTLDLFARGRFTDWRNRLIWGDKKYVLPSLLPEFAGKVNLIYIDPPFFTGTDQTYAIPIHDSEEFIIKKPSLIEEAAYRNVWRDGSDSFCAWIYDTLVLLRELLQDNGAIFIRYDQYWSHYVKVTADEVFGKNNFQNDITLKRIYKNLTNQGKRSLQIATDSLFLYFKSEKGMFYEVEQELDETREGYWRKMDDSSGVRHPPERIILGGKYYPPQGKHFKFSQAKIDRMSAEGNIRINEKGRPEYWVEATDKKALTSNWTDISSYSFTTGYPTENSEVLLERAIKLCSKKEDLLLDCFSGSGTTPAVAEKLGRRWIACDIGRFAIHTTRKRLLGIENLKPFVVQNLGKYERQQWMQAEFENPENRAIQEKAYRYFILDLYHAEPLTGYVWLHGVKGDRMVHIGSVDTPVSIGDVKSVVQEFWKTVGKPLNVTGNNNEEVPEATSSYQAETLNDSYRTNGIDLLGWEFAFELNETARQFAAANNVDLKFKKIPREVLEKRAVEQGDIQFFELAYLDVGISQEGAKVAITLNDFVVPPDDIPQEARSAITHWSQFIDYWAVDWNYRDDTFHNEWQSYRTKKDRKIELGITHKYDSPGSYNIQVKVIDVLGNDTTKGIRIEIK